MEGFSLLVIVGLVLLGLVLSAGVGFAEKDKPTTHTIFISAVEIKGATTAKKLMPPAANPKELSKGYGFKAPGEADKQDPHKWEVSSYMFTPSFVTVRQGDTVKLTAFIVNGDMHEVWVTDPDGQKVIANTKWNRGREYTAEFVAKKAGPYQLMCSEHSPSMITTFLVLPR
jgi:plastocyanin